MAVSASTGSHPMPRSTAKPALGPRLIPMWQWVRTTPPAVDGVGGPRDDPVEPRGRDSLAGVVDARPEVGHLGLGPPVGVVGLPADVEDVGDAAVDDELDGLSDGCVIVVREVAPTAR